MRLLILMSIIAATTGCAPPWRQLAPLPDREGFAGAYAGVSGGALLVAGGASFPGKKPWEGGAKVWYDTVYVLHSPQGAWEIAGKLPRPLGYGLSVTHNDRVICVGGSDAKQHHAEAFAVRWNEGKLSITPLPPLPRAMANGCGALVGDVLYVAGGQAAPDSTTTLNEVWRINLAEATPKWEAVEPCPGGPRMLALAAGCDGALFLAGGTDLSRGADGKPQRRYLTDAWRYDQSGWKRLADLPRPAVAPPSPAPFDSRNFYLLGGDDGSQLATPPLQHRGFSSAILHYDLKANQWREAGTIPAPRVTVPCVAWGKSWIIPSGEMRPGRRSPEVWSWSPEE